MRQSTRMALTVACVVLAGGCTGLTQTAVTTPPAPLTRPAAQAPLARLMGVALAPASLITNNGSSLLTNNGSSLVTNGAANARGVLAVEESAPVADAEVVVLDENDTPVAGVKTVRTDAKGQFTLENVPTDGNIQVVVKKPGFSLTTIVRPATGGKPVSVTPASTLVAAHLKKQLAGDKKALKKVPEAQLESLTASVEAAIAEGDMPLDLTSPEQALKGYDHVMSKHPELAEKGMAAVAEAQAAAKVPDNPQAQAAAGDRPDTSPVTPAASRKPDQAPTSPSDQAQKPPAPNGGGGKPADKGGKK